LHQCWDDADQPDDTPEDLLTLLINGTGLKQNLKRGARPFSLPENCIISNVGPTSFITSLDCKLLIEMLYDDSD